MTGDPEFRPLANAGLVAVEWLPMANREPPQGFHFHYAPNVASVDLAVLDNDLSDEER
jgi:hypothetical protein